MHAIKPLLYWCSRLQSGEASGILFNIRLLTRIRTGRVQCRLFERVSNLSLGRQRQRAENKKFLSIILGNFWRNEESSRHIGISWINVMTSMPRKLDQLTHSGAGCLRETKKKCHWFDLITGAHWEGAIESWLHRYHMEDHRIQIRRNVSIEDLSSAKGQ